MNHCGIDEEAFRRRVYMSAVCRCFPGETPTGGDRVPDRAEIAECGAWLAAEFAILRPELVIPVGRLAIVQLIPPAPLTEIIGRTFRGVYAGHACDVIPLPHPSGASPWPRIEPGKGLDAPRAGTHPRAPGVPGGGGRGAMRKGWGRWEWLYITLCIVVFVVAFPVAFPVAMIQHTLAERRKKQRVSETRCGRCGEILGQAALDRADAEWSAHVERLHRDHPGKIFRMVRTVNAVCVACGQSHRYDEKADAFEAVADEPFKRRPASEPGGV